MEGDRLHGHTCINKYCAPIDTDSQSGTDGGEGCWVHTAHILETLFWVTSYLILRTKGHLAVGMIFYFKCY